MQFKTVRNKQYSGIKQRRQIILHILPHEAILKMICKDRNRLISIQLTC